MAPQVQLNPKIRERKASHSNNLFSYEKSMVVDAAGGVATLVR